jgi:mRNA-degrading endonuclease RelE of RelBE toxin-antitoxin system
MQVIVTPEAQKQYERLSVPEQKKIKKKLSVLESSPLEGKKLSGKMSELRSLRAWPYRILYYIDNARSFVFVVTIAHRQGVYK